MKFAVAGMLIASSALVAGCAVYPDGTPAYGGGYPAGYDPGYDAYGYGGPVVQSGVYIGGGNYYGPGYYGGPPPRRYWDDGPGYRHPSGGYYGRPGDGGGHGGGHGGNRGGPQPAPQAGGGGGGGNHGGQGGQQAGGGHPPPVAVGGAAPSRPTVAPAPSGNQGGNRGGSAPRQNMPFGG